MVRDSRRLRFCPGETQETPEDSTLQQSRLSPSTKWSNARALGWEVVETIPSPITGMEGNREFLLYARRAGVGV
jgi:predicted rRNA methylase YqxC with S4 and FtsJ domains